MTRLFEKYLLPPWQIGIF